MLKIKQVVPPSLEPVTLEQVKRALRFDLSDDTPDADINDLIPAAREWCETHQNRAYLTTTFELALSDWPRANRIRLPRPRLQEIASVTYRDDDGASHTWDALNYVIDDFSEPGYLVKVTGVPWPTHKLASNGLVIRYVAGYGNSRDDVPKLIKRAIVTLAAYWFENGMCEPPCAVYNLLAYDRVVPI